MKYLQWIVKILIIILKVHTHGFVLLQANVLATSYLMGENRMPEFLYLCQLRHSMALCTRINSPKQHTIPYIGFFEVLKFREWLIFGFFTILFSWMGFPKAHTLQWIVDFFEGLNFMNDQHPRNLRNLHTLKKPTIQ